MAGNFVFTRVSAGRNNVVASIVQMSHMRGEATLFI
jgi:hypothetical protein